MMKEAEDTAGKVDDGLQDDSIEVEDGIDQSDQSNGAEDDTNDGGMSMSTRKASEGNEVGDDGEEDNIGDKKEDKESSRRGAEIGDVRIRKKILESVREKFDNVRGESFRKKTNLEGSYNEDDRKQTGSLGSGLSGLPLTLTATLKRKVIEMKHSREEKSSMIGVEKVKGHMEGLVTRMERMLTAGDDLNKEREIRFRESI